MSLFGAHYEESLAAGAFHDISYYKQQKEAGQMEHTFKNSGLKVDLSVEITDPVRLGRTMGMQGFEQQLDFLYGLAAEQRAQGATISDMFSSFRSAMERQSDDVLEEILPIVIDLSQQIERELQQRHNRGRGATTIHHV